MSSNFEIPVEFIKNERNQNMNNSMNHFLKQNHIPTLNLDLSNKALSLELKLSELREKEKNIKMKYKEVFDKVKKISKEKKIEKEKLNNKEKERIYISSLIEENKAKIEELYETQKNIANMFPQNKSKNKIISDSDVKKIKIEPSLLDENYKIKNLNKDLIDYEKYIKYLNDKKKPKIDLLLQKIKLSVDEVFPGYDIKLYGAYGSGIVLPWSDINIILINNNNRESKNSEVKNNITEIETTIGEKTLLSDSEMNNNLANKDFSVSDINNNEEVGALINIFNCLKKNNSKVLFNYELNIIKNESINYLIITTNEEFGNIKIYISIDRPNHPGLKRLELIKSFINEYPPLKPTILALERILKKANLNEQCKGGLPFYALILMVVSFIQNQKYKNNYSFKEENENINGIIFYEFLKFFGIKFDYTKYMIMTYKINEITNGENFSLKEKENQFSEELIILDPVENKINVGKPANQYKNIKMAFLIAFMVTQEDCDCGCHYGKAIFEHDYSLTEHCYLKRMFNSVKRFNKTD
jgi:DNA polymerase sigma